MKHEYSCSTSQIGSDVPADDVATLVGNVLKGVGYTLQESGRLVAAVGTTKGDATGSPVVDLQGLQVLGTLVRVGDGLHAERVVLARFEDDTSSHTALVDWGDGTAETSGEVVSDGSGRFSVIGSHRYSRPGEFVITLRVTRGDATLAVATASALVGSSNKRFMAWAFQRLVGRPMNSDDQTQLAGETRGSILRSILASRAFLARVVADIYTRMLGRQPDVPELDRGIDLIAAGTTLPLKASVASSNEYFEKRGSAQGVNFVYALYSDLLGRVPQSAEVTDAVRVANDASARLELAEQLLQSAEGRAQLAQTSAHQYANRAATPQEMVAAISALDVRDNDIIVRTFGLQTEAIFPGQPDGLTDDAVADYAVQFVVVLPPDQVTAFATQVQTKLAQVFPAAVLTVLTSTESGQTLVAAWLSPGNDTDRQAWMARTADIKNGSPIVSGSEVGFFASLDFLKQSAQAGFAASPNRLNGAGNPDSNGDTLLTGIDVSLDPNSNTVTTNVSGVQFVHPVLGVSGSFGIRFTHHLNDTLGGTKTETDCGGTPFQVIDVASPPASTDVDSGDEALAILFGVLQLLLSPAFGVASLGALTNLLSGGQGPASGVGAGFVNSLLHTQLVPPAQAQGGKIIFNYTDPVVDTTGLTIQAFVAPATRVPSVQIAGPTFIPIYKYGAPTSASSRRQQYSIQLCDLRIDGSLPVIWTTPDRSTVIESPSSATTYVDFGSGLATTRTLHVKVGPDLDGAVQETTLSVLIEYFERLPPAPGHLPLHLL